jgi:ApbE superfamily uncharacterized protein (UPF0280 family)
MYEERVYRRGMGGISGMTDFEVVEEETDLWISIDSSSYFKGIEEEIRGLVLRLREDLKEYISRDPRFLIAFEPYRLLPEAPEIVMDMARAAEKAGVGPMAAVAGAVAWGVGREIREKTGCGRLMIENGGDIYIFGECPFTIAVYAGESPLSEKVGIRVNVSGELGVCTSSGTVGHARSFGRADACVVISDSVVTADAFATAYCNKMQTQGDIQRVLDLAKDCPDVRGVLVIMEETLGAWGDLELVGLD